MSGKEDPRVLQFIKLFNQEKFFEAHEVLEDLWLEMNTPDKHFYQGLIQLAAVGVHLQRNNSPGAEKLLKTAAGYLTQYPEMHHQIHHPTILEGLSKSWQSGAAFPKIPF